MSGQPTCYTTIPEGPHYRADAVAAGAAVLGYRVVRTPPSRINPGDLLLTWNLHRHQSEIAAAYRSVGGHVIVAENGYIGRDPAGQQYYALARDGHNGSGRWWVGHSSRWAALGIHAAPRFDYRRDGYVLIVGQRGIGSDLMRSPANWHNAAAAAIERDFNRPVRIREHPGLRTPAVPLVADLDGASAVVIWSSAVGVAALVRGIPVYYAAPYWIGALSATRLHRTLPSPRMAPGDALHVIAWAQWSLAEIATGEPFRILLCEANRDPQPDETKGARTPEIVRFAGAWAGRGM